MKRYQALAIAVGSRLRCLEFNKNGSHDQAIADWEARLVKLTEDFPHGSGFDSGTSLNYDLSTGERLVFTTAFHHMDEHGFYDGWTNHTVWVKPSLELEYRLTIGGPDRNGIKSLIADAFNAVLDSQTQA